MSHDDEPIDRAVGRPLNDDELIFLRDEGLHLLATFRSVRDKTKRELIVELVRAIAEGQAPINGS